MTAKESRRINGEDWAKRSITNRANGLIVGIERERLESLTLFSCAGKQECVCCGGLSCTDFSDDISAADPVSFGEVGD